MFTLVRNVSSHGAGGRQSDQPKCCPSESSCERNCLWLLGRPWLQYSHLLQCFKIQGLLVSHEAFARVHACRDDLLLRLTLLLRIVLDPLLFREPFGEPFEAGA